MAVATFDTLKFANPLAFAKILQVDLKDVAAKTDSERTAKAIRADLDPAVKDLCREVKGRDETNLAMKELRDEFKLAIKDSTRRLGLRFQKDANDAASVRWMPGVMSALRTGLFILPFFFRVP